MFGLYVSVLERGEGGFRALRALGFRRAIGRVGFGLQDLGSRVFGLRNRGFYCFMVLYFQIDGFRF